MSKDSHLQQAVVDELAWEPSVVAAGIGVAVEAGIVSLTGHVATFAQKHTAEAAALRVKGVRAVAEAIEVVLPFEHRRADAELAAAAAERLGWDVAIPKDAIQIKVEKGWVTLTGEVEWHFQKDAAAQELRHLSGVVGVSNHVAIRPRVDVANINDSIMHALHRSWYFDPKTITVEARGSVVRLTGTVHLPHDKQLAAATAWAAPGVTGVQNDITVI